MAESNADKSYKFWDRVSGWSKAESAANSNLVRHINTIFGIYIMPDDTVLDFGCGTGTITLRMARNAKNIYGVDVSDGMLERARRNQQDQKADNAAFIKITMLDEMFQAGSFDVITVFNVLQYVENRKELLEQFYKLLRPQGKLIVAAPCFSDTNSLSAMLVRFLRFVRIMPKTYFFTVNEIERKITDMGLTIVESADLSELPEKFIVAVK